MLFRSYLRDLGFTSLAPQPRRRRGRRGRPDLFYARLARAYVARVRAESEKPVRDLAADAALARRLGLSPRDLTPALVQDALNTARERNLLTKPPKPGYAGGELTPRALAVLKQAREPLPSKHSASTKRKR